MPTQEIIIYRSPLEKMQWDAYLLFLDWFFDNPEKTFIALAVAIILCVCFLRWNQRSGQ